MKIRSMNIWSVVLATAIVGGWATASNAADERSTEQPTNDLNLVPTVPPVPIAPSLPPQLIQRVQDVQGRAEAVVKALAGARPRTNVAGSIRTAAEAVRDAKGDEAKAAAQKNLSDLLGKYFDEDTKRRQEELTQIEERLAKLRELLERRRAKKQDILELQMKVALNEADGLGFYDSEHSAGPKTPNSFFRTTIDGLPVDAFGSGGNPYAAPVKTRSSDSVPEPKKSTSGSSGSNSSLPR